jgi:hypothetical protein
MDAFLNSFKEVKKISISDKESISKSNKLTNKLCQLAKESIEMLSQFKTI